MTLVKCNKFNRSSIFRSYLNSSIVELRKQTHNIKREKEHCSWKWYWTKNLDFELNFQTPKHIFKYFQVKLIQPNFLLHWYLALYTYYYTYFILFYFYQEHFTSVQYSLSMLNLSHTISKFHTILMFVIIRLETTFHIWGVGIFTISALNPTALIQQHIFTA